MDGFCNYESTEIVEGTISWPESIKGAVVTVPCPFGPSNATASRICVSRLNWTSPDAIKCATSATQGFQSLEGNIPEVYIVYYCDSMSLN